MKIPNTDPRLPRYYLGTGNQRTGGARGFFKPFDLDSKPSSVLRGMPDNRHDVRAIRHDAVANRGDSMNGLGLIDANGNETAGDMPAISNIFKSLVQAYNQQQIINLNIERMRMGYQPISGSALAPTVNFGMSPETTQMLLIGGLAIGGIILATRRRGRK